MTTTQDWERVARFVRARRHRLGLKQASTGVSSATWTKIENAKSSSYKPFMLAKIEHELDWPDGTILAIADGGEPPEASVAGDLADRLSRLEDRFEEVDRRLDRVLRVLEGRER